MSGDNAVAVDVGVVVAVAVYVKDVAGTCGDWGRTHARRHTGEGHPA